MGLLSDIYISRENEAVKYDTAPQTFTERAEFKGITSLELSMLWAILRNVQWDAAMLDDFACLLEIDSGERLIQRFPEPMVAALSQLTHDQIRDVSIKLKWAATEELASSSSDMQPAVEEMTRLARLATNTGRGLYLWNCV